MRPKRIRVEILVVKDGEVLVTINKSADGTWHGLPGGGIDDDVIEVAVLRELKEETGIIVKNLKLTNEKGIKEGYASDVPGRSSQYSGSITYLFVGDYDRLDLSKINQDDLLVYTFMKPKEALRLFKEHYEACGGSGEHAVKYLTKEINQGRL